MDNLSQLQTFLINYYLIIGTHKITIFGGKYTMQTNKSLMYIYSILGVLFKMLFTVYIFNRKTRTKRNNIVCEKSFHKILHFQQYACKIF